MGAALKLWGLRDVELEGWLVGWLNGAFQSERVEESQSKMERIRAKELSGEKMK